MVRGLFGAGLKLVGYGIKEARRSSIRNRNKKSETIETPKKLTKEQEQELEKVLNECMEKVKKLDKTKGKKWETDTLTYEELDNVYASNTSSVAFVFENIAEDGRFKTCLKNIKSHYDNFKEKSKPKSIGDKVDFSVSEFSEFAKNVNGEANEMKCGFVAKFKNIVVKDMGLRKKIVKLITRFIDFTLTLSSRAEVEEKKKNEGKK